MSRDVAVTGNGTPGWVKVILGPTGTAALAVFLLLWLLGALPLPTPVWGQVFVAIAAHDRTTQESLRVQRLICAALWRDQPAMKTACWAPTTPGNGGP